jgi:hypothetical protein
MTTFQQVGVPIAEALLFVNHGPEQLAAWYAVGVNDPATLTKIMGRSTPENWLTYESQGFNQEDALKLIVAGIGPKNASDVRDLLKRPGITADEIVANKQSGTPASVMKELFRLGWSGQPVGKDWTAATLATFRKEGGTLADLYTGDNEPVATVPNMPEVRFSKKMNDRGLDPWEYRQFGPSEYDWGYEISDDELDRFLPFALDGYENLSLVRHLSDERIVGEKLEREAGLTDEQKETLDTICFRVASETGLWPSMFLRTVANAMTREAPKQDITPIGFDEVVTLDRAYRYTTCLPDVLSQTHKSDVYIQNEAYRRVWSCWAFHNPDKTRAVYRSGLQFVVSLDWLADELSLAKYPGIWWSNWEKLCDSNHAFGPDTVFQVSSWANSRHRNATYTWREVQVWSANGITIETGLWLRTQYPDTPIAQAAAEYRAFYADARNKVEL